jgi:hypothetical protein
MRGMLLLSAAFAVSIAALAETNADLREQVRRTEIAFAKTMADREHAAFVSFLAEETVFMGRRREGDGRWRIIFDIGCPPCGAASQSSPSPAASPR